MGLCKCPKRKVTNLFCFEHRVNVCEYCLTENHPRCVIQSYLNWLKDSDYVPNCALCGISLMEGEVVRLMCYDVFHLACLEKHYKKLPPNTAPAGYKCYTCQAPIFPMPNQAGLVIDKMREALSKYNWARVGLGLPLFDEPVVDDEDELVGDNFDIESSKELSHENESTYPKPFESAAEPLPTTNNKVDTTASLHYQVYNDDSIDSNFLDSPLSKYINDTSTLSMPSVDDSLAGDNVDPLMGAVSRKLYGGNHGADYESYFIGEDVDGVNKYKRRSAFSWLSRWVKSRMLRGRGRETRALPRRGLVVILFLLLLFFTLLITGMRLGRGGDDPSFDPHHNPMVHVDEPRAAFVDMGGRAVDDPLLAVQAAAAGG